MADPKNPLDVFVTYTYHFELHAAKTWDELKAVEGENDANLSTTRTMPNRTLLINTRRDAHQTIDNVKFEAISSLTDAHANMSACQELSFDVEEPGGVGFTTKLVNLKAIHGIKSFSSDLHFGLKIMFVGRLADNTIKTVYMPKIIPLQFCDANGSFTHQGSKYHMLFVISSSFLNKNPNNPANHGALSITQMNRNISVSALTCQEALSSLENKLNSHYEMIFEKEIELTGGKRIKYKINITDPEIKGQLKVANKDSYAPDDLVKISFEPNADIVSMIRKILFSTDEVTQMIADSYAGAKQEFHPGVKIPVITPHYLLRDGSLEVNIDVGIYRGEGGASKDKNYTFSFYFCEPGKNVDVLGLDIKFPSFVSWLNLKTTQSTSLLTNAGSDTGLKWPKVHSEDVIFPDALHRRLSAQLQEKARAELPQNAVAIIGASSNERMGQTSVLPEQVSTTRLAFSTMSEINGCTDFQLNMQIRGHLGILGECNVQPDGSVKAFGQNRGIWIKVNIFDQEGNPFYYTGWYQLMSVENVFSGGKFTQNCSIMMMEQNQQSTPAESFRKQELNTQRGVR